MAWTFAAALHGVHQPCAEGAEAASNTVGHPLQLEAGEAYSSSGPSAVAVVACSVEAACNAEVVAAAWEVVQVFGLDGPAMMVVGQTFAFVGRLVVVEDGMPEFGQKEQPRLQKAVEELGRQ